MKIAFGNFNESSKISNWITPLKHASIYNSNDWETTVMYGVKATPLGMKSFQHNGKEKIILFAKTKSHFGEYADCRICGQIFSYAVFIKNEDFWELETVVKNAGERGSWGDLSSPTLVKIGLDTYALSFGFGGMQQGYIYGGDNYLEIKKDYIQEILQIFTESDNSGAVGGSSKDYEISKSKVEFIKGSNIDYFDVKVTTSGKKAVKIGKRFVPRPFVKTERYSYINGKYQLAK